jgi:hypothetical protein
MLDLVYEGLRVNDPRLNAISAEVLARMSGAAARPLVQQAADRKNKPRHRVRLLEAIGRIAAADPAGVDADPGVFFDLMYITRDRNAAVREAAGRLIGDLPQYRAGVPPGHDAQ